MLTPQRLFKCLGDPTRLTIMLLLADEDELCVCELVCALDTSQPKISRHLAELRQAGLLEDRRQGQWVYYRWEPTLPAWAHTILRAAVQGQQTELPAYQQRLQSMGERPLRQAACR
ncbi:MAG: metalloregulator ArsR/SmtB family transcription factor [Gammaproteobacteria bacterium]|nr:metalloregulator ArsR/SmtB family transcription factor [Gammaproteobacteria bacterium]